LVLVLVVATGMGIWQQEGLLKGSVWACAGLAGSVRWVGMVEEELFVRELRERKVVAGRSGREGKGWVCWEVGLLVVYVGAC
jgi:hypothetical protein